MNSLAIVLTNDIEEASPIALTVALHRQGFEAASKILEDGSVAFDLGSGAEMVAVHVPSPHPDAINMPQGPTTPPADEIASAGAHILVAALNLDHLVGDDPEKIDLAMLQITCAVMGTTDAVAAMLGHGVCFHQAQTFVGTTVLFGELERVPVPLAVNVTIGQNSAGRATLLTHGLARYGRMDLLVACTSDIDESTDFVWQMVDWLMENKLHRLVPGTLVPSNKGSEQIALGVPSPLDNGATVIYLDLAR